MLRNLQLDGAVVDDPLGLYLSDQRGRSDRPWVLLNMISSVDGATTVDGTSTALGDADDRTLFKALRAIPDVILVGAGTARAEDYQPVRLDEDRRSRRRAAGLEEVPRLVVLTGRLSLDPSARLFSDPDYKPIVLTRRGAPPDRVEALSDVADIAMIDDLDAKGIIDHLGGAKVILCEGGPSLNGQLIESDLVDELNITIAPMVASGESRRIAHGVATAAPLDMRLDRALRGDRSLFLRYLRD
jgi:5-amino-6-(5-phosphoribosylamino)uracil reductase